MIITFFVEKLASNLMQIYTGMIDEAFQVSFMILFQFLIVKENKGNEGTCVGVSRHPVRDYSHRTTSDMWLYRAYR